MGNEARGFCLFLCPFITLKQLKSLTTFDSVASVAEMLTHRTAVPEVTVLNPKSANDRNVSVCFSVLLLLLCFFYFLGHKHYLSLNVAIPFAMLFH